METQMKFRVGLNLGDVIIEDENLYGDGVNVAARLEALAELAGSLYLANFTMKSAETGYEFYFNR